MLPDRLERTQKMLDNGMSNLSIAKKEKISEGTIRYALQTGKLKKNKEKQGTRKQTGANAARKI
jgi:transposase